MPYTAEFNPHLLDILNKLKKQDPQLYRRLIKKIEQILENPHHYKELGNVLKGCCRTHIGSYVLIFEIHEASQAVWFVNFDHHDHVYR